MSLRQGTGTLGARFALNPKWPSDWRMNGVEYDLGGTPTFADGVSFRARKTAHGELEIILMDATESVTFRSPLLLTKRQDIIIVASWERGEATVHVNGHRAERRDLVPIPSLASSDGSIKFLRLRASCAVS